MHIGLTKLGLRSTRRSSSSAWSILIFTVCYVLTNTLEGLIVAVIHWPVAFPAGKDLFPKTANKQDAVFDTETSLVDTWKAMIKLLDTGKVRKIRSFSCADNQSPIRPRVLASQTLPFHSCRVSSTRLVLSLYACFLPLTSNACVASYNINTGGESGRGSSSSAP